MNVVTVNVLTAIIVALLSYFMGSIPNGVWIGKIFFHKDIRDYGSHNSGGTNAGRVLGKKIGFIVILLDMLKTIGVIYATWAVVTFSKLSTYYVFADNPEIFQDLRPLYYWLSALMAAIGHCFPIFLKFKGGKAVASFMGIAVFTSWIGLLVSFAYLGTLKMKKMVSLSSIIMAVLHPLVAWIVFILEATKVCPSYIFSWTFALNANALQLGFFYALAMSIIGLLIVIRHKANISRIKEGKESKIGWMK